MVKSNSMVILKKKEWETLLKSINDLIDAHIRLLNYSKKLKKESALQSFTPNNRHKKDKIKGIKKEVQQPVLKVCVYCGRGIRLTDLFCDHCGKKIR